MKTEPESYSIEDLEKDGQTSWDGVRNYQARNFMRDDMSIGDQVLVYHSNGKPPGIAGLARVCRTAYPDRTALDPSDHHYDQKATPDNPIWCMVDIAFEERFARFISLEDLKSNSQLDGMIVLQRGSRLSIQPVEKRHFDLICRLGRQKS